ncbi:MAG: 1-acyl-sn-glycerol-3-phosphate acyltransferase [Elusimicrobia bacterium CG06_land_8_20_14_3_00_38_11]|nr:MAG: 1-acyl-sn-glycerol-3-phosphate acyltransferase [Elusimicrobia bacterium CG06_land_8_20_14_3_00_38_11]
MIYWIGWLISRVVFTVIYRREITGLENLPKNSSYILAANHQSYADPPLVGSCIKKKIYYIAKKELFRIPVFGWLIKKANAFPVDREVADAGALKNALKILQSGNILLIFPEGTRYKPGKVRKLKNGAAMLSAATNSPVVPVAIINSDKLSSFKKLKIKFGVPMRFETTENYGSITKKIMSEIEKLKNEDINR